MKIKKQMTRLGVLLCCVFLQAVYAEGKMYHFKTDMRAKVVSFNPNQIYSLRTQYLISTDIIFGNDEIVNTDDIHLGDATAWDVQAYRNHLYVKAKKLDAKGNLSVTTNKYAYHFVLSVSNDEESARQVFMMK